MRKAVAHALNREALVRAFYSRGAEVAKELTPPALWGYASHAHAPVPWDPYALISVR